jgi:hypothetical protein
MYHQTLNYRKEQVVGEEKDSKENENYSSQLSSVLI